MARNSASVTLAGLALVAAATLAAAQDAQPESPAPALPAGAEEASARLAASPRHGEWVDVPMADSEVKINSYVVYPEIADKAPAVIVIHEIYGLTDWVRGVADQLAAEGFIAIAPDFLSGMGPDGGGTASLGESVGQTIRALTDEAKVARLNAVRDYVKALPACSGQVGCVGYCWGGSTSFLYATAQPELGAAVVYYGSASNSEEQLGKIQAPVLGLYGGNDARVNSTVQGSEEQPGTRALMEKLGKSFEAHFLEGAGHGFLRQLGGQDGANLKAAQEAWPRTIAFFKEHLTKE